MDANSPATATGIASLSLVIPAYNEAAVIEAAIREAVDSLRSLGLDFEILVVDDGSADDTAARANSVAEDFHEVQVLRLPKNLGYGAALRIGFERATKALVAFTDADCQFYLRELHRLIMLARDYDIACGYRIDRQDVSTRRFCSAGYNVLVRTLLGTGVRDCDCALKVFRREVLESVHFRSDGFLVNAELLTLARQSGFSIVEVGVTHRPRLAGASTVSLSHAIPVCSALLRFWWNRVMFPSDTQPATNEWPPRRSWIMGICLAALAGLLLFTNLSYPLFEPDEARYAQIALEMHAAGDYIVPRLRGEPYLDKPPLLYWLICASYHFFEPGPWAARLPCAIAGWLMVLTAYVMGSRLVGARSAWIGSLLLLLCSGFILSGRFLIMDGVLALCTTVGLLAAGNAIRDSSRAYRWWLLAGTACGFGILAKGPIAAVICLPPALAVAFLSGGRHRPAWLGWLAFVSSMALVAGPWFCAIAVAQPEFLEHFFLKHNVLRFTSAFDHQLPWWFYIPVVSIGMFPGSLLFPALARYLFGRSQRLREQRTRELGYLFLAAVWILLFFSLSACKLPTYVLPAIPLLCMLLGKMLDDMLRATDVETSFEVSTKRATVVAMVVTLIAAAAAGIADLLISDHAALPVAFAVGFMILSLVALTLLLLLRSRAAWATSPTAATLICTVVGLYGFAHVLPEFAMWRSNIHNLASFHAEVGDDVPIVFLARHSDSACFSLISGEIVEFSEEQLEEFEAFVAQHELAVVVATREIAETVQELQGERLELRRQPSGPRRNLYTARPVAPLIASPADSRTLR
jgi:dolichol-phosphate mannosyltransferase